MPVKARLIQLINIDDKIIKMVGWSNNKFETAVKLTMLYFIFATQITTRLHGLVNVANKCCNSIFKIITTTRAL